jgi:hypothetical protein
MLAVEEVQMPAKSKKVQKNLRISPEADRLIQLVAAYEHRPEADLLEDALGIYLQHRAISWRKELGLPVEAFADGETTMAEVLDRFDRAFGEALAGAVASAEPRESAKDRLRNRHTSAVAR